MAKRGNPYHDPKNGEFTSGPGGPTSGKFTAAQMKLINSLPSVAEGWTKPRNPKKASNPFGLVVPDTVPPGQRQQYLEGMTKAYRDSPDMRRFAAIDNNDIVRREAAKMQTPIRNGNFNSHTNKPVASHLVTAPKIEHTITGRHRRSR